MMPKSTICVVLMTLAHLAIAHGGRISNELTTNRERVPLDMEGRIIEVPIIGGLILLLSKPLKIIWYLVSTAWWLVGYKLSTISLAINTGIWLLHHVVSVILKAVAVFGLCKITGKCSLDYATHRLAAVSDHVAYAARSLDNGISRIGEGSY